MASNFESIPGGKLTQHPANAADEDSRNLLAQKRGNELFFAVIGPVGAGCTRAAESLKRALSTATFAGQRYTTPDIIKASALIRAWANDVKVTIPTVAEGSFKTLAYQRDMQKVGDEMRSRFKDPAAVARECMRKIAQLRADLQGQKYVPGAVVEPDGKPRAYIIDSLKHPAEVMLLRKVYGDAFTLIGVVCTEKVRRKRILKEFFPEAQWNTPAISNDVDTFMERDGDDGENPLGQHVTDAFHEADYFVDNTQDDPNNTQAYLNDSLGRLIDIITHSKIVRPTTEETAMHTAASAQLRSACLSRQVGASLIDSAGNIVATGTNEAPRAGGGVYGEQAAGADFRCAYHSHGVYCRNNREQNKIINDLIDKFPQLKLLLMSGIFAASI